MREWLSGGASASQAEGRGFESRLALIESQKDGQSIFLAFFVARKGKENEKEDLCNRRIAMRWKEYGCKGDCKRIRTQAF